MDSCSKKARVLKMSYLQIPVLKKHNRDHEKLFYFQKLTLLGGSTFYLKDKKNFFWDLKKMQLSLDIIHHFTNANFCSPQSSGGYKKLQIW